MKLLPKVSLLLALFIITSCGTEDFTGSGNLVTEDRSISGIDKIDCSGSIEVSITQSSDMTLQVTADDNLLTNIITETSGSTLKIKLKDGQYDGTTFKVDIGLPNIEDVDKTGTGDLDLTGFDNLETINIDQTGTGNLNFSGKAITLNLDKTGTGNFNGFDFECETINIDQTGIGDAEVRCTKLISGSLTGIGNIKYKGNPTIEVDVTGIGMIEDAN